MALKYFSLFRVIYIKKAMTTQMKKAQEDNNDKRHTNAVDTTEHSPFHASIDSVQKK
jgi:hypothetical protein